MRTNRLLIVPLLLLAIALVVIGTLQYRWLGSVSEAERRRMHDNLEFASERLAGEISGLIHGVFDAFLISEVGEVTWPELRHPELVAGVYIADRDGDEWSVRKLDPQTGQIAASPLPAALEPLRRDLDRVGPRGQERFPGPLFTEIPALMVISVPDLSDPMTHVERPRRVALVQLDRSALEKAIRERIAPLFAFAPDGVDVEVLAEGSVLYQSTANMGPPDVVHPFRPLEPRRRPPRRPGPDEGRDRPPPREEMWELRVRHHGGGLDAIVAAAHRRNLAVAFLVLLILVAASALLVALLRRGEKLRAQQTQFIASMSHELNTPLAVLRVASENLNDGIAKDPEKVQRYLRTIARETAHLSEMVNHVLELAGMNAHVAVAAREAVDVGTVIQDAVMQSKSMVDASSIEVECDIEDELPRVAGNRQALTRAVQNLVTNAMRHAGSGKWVGVRATKNGGGVKIVVEDRGPGIAPADAAHVFQPFYRGRGSSTVRGTGLGLTIVKQIVTDHGGTVTVERGRAAGAAFVIELPSEGAS